MIIKPMAPKRKRDQVDNNHIFSCLSNIYTSFCVDFLNSYELNNLMQCSKHFMFLQPHLIETSVIKYSAVEKNVWLKANTQYIKKLNINSHIYECFDLCGSLVLFLTDELNKYFPNLTELYFEGHYYAKFFR